MEKLKESVRTAILSWLIPGYGKLESRIADLAESYKSIESHLDQISDFASYVKEKEEQASAVFQIMSEQSSQLASLSKEEVEEEIRSAQRVRVSLLDQPAIGSREVLDKNNKIAQIDMFISELKTKVGGIPGVNSSQASR